MAKQTARKGVKRRRAPTAGQGRGRSRKTVEEEAGRDEFFIESDAEQNAGEKGNDGDGEGVPEEGAEQKRLRLAKEYLAQLKQSEALSDGDEDGDEDGVTTHDLLSKRLHQQALQASGHIQRKIADRVQRSTEAEPSGRTSRCHRFSVTAIALTADDSTVYSVSKDGSIVEMDVETGAKVRFRRSAEARSAAAPAAGGAPEWVAGRARPVNKGALLAAAISDDGQYLATGGGDCRVHVWDARTRQHVVAFPGHKDMVAGLSFREGSHELLSCGFDRTVKIWSLDDRAYVDTLFGHQAEVLAVDVLRQERAVTAGHDHSCRVWKIPEESQLIFRAHSPAIDCVRYITGTDWVSGGSDGSLALWTQTKKRPVSVVRGAHTPAAPAPALAVAGSDNAAASWVQSVAVCRGTDLVASGAGDGWIRLWAARSALRGGVAALEQLPSRLPACGFVNALAIARSSRFVVAGMGQEPRLGRWGLQKAARNGLLLHRLELEDE